MLVRKNSNKVEIMAKDITVSSKFDSNGQVVIGPLTISAKELQSVVKGVQNKLNLYLKI